MVKRRKRRVIVTHLNGQVSGVELGLVCQGTVVQGRIETLACFLLAFEQQQHPRFVSNRQAAGLQRTFSIGCRQGWLPQTLPDAAAQCQHVTFIAVSVQKLSGLAVGHIQLARGHQRIDQQHPVLRVCRRELHGLARAGNGSFMFAGTIGLVSRISCGIARVRRVFARPDLTPGGKILSYTDNPGHEPRLKARAIDSGAAPECLKRQRTPIRYAVLTPCYKRLPFKQIKRFLGLACRQGGIGGDKPKVLPLDCFEISHRQGAVQISLGKCTLSLTL